MEPHVVWKLLLSGVWLIRFLKSDENSTWYKQVFKDFLHYFFASYSFNTTMIEKPYSTEIRNLTKLIMKTCHVNTLMHNLVSPLTISEVTLNKRLH